MSSMVLAPLAVLVIGSTAVAVLTRRLARVLDDLDDTVLTLGRLEASRAELDDETTHTRASMDRLASS